MSEMQPVVMTINLLGGLALFLYGMEKMTDGMKAAAGKQMIVLLAKLTSNAVTGAKIGTSITAILASIGKPQDVKRFAPNAGCTPGRRRSRPPAEASRPGRPTG